MEEVVTEQQTTRGSVAPHEPKSPVPSAMSSTTQPAEQQQTTQTPVLPSAPVASVTESAPPASETSPTASAASTTAGAPASTTASTAPASTTAKEASPSATAPAVASSVSDRAASLAREPSPAVPTTSASTAASTSAPASASATTVTPTLPSIESSTVPLAETTPPKQVNGHKSNYEDGEAESELSEPTSTVHSPSGEEVNEFEDEIVVGRRANRANKSSPVRGPSDNEDQTMADAPEEPVPHYPKRKRNSLFQDLSESKMEAPTSTLEDKAPQTNVAKPNKPPRQSLGSVKGVLLGYWRDSAVPNERDRHAVIGFIDVRDRLRTRIQPMNQAGQSLAVNYPLPPGPGGSWVTFEKVVFNKHLVGLDHYQVKEYVRMRSEASEETEEARKAAEKAAVKEAIRRVKENPLLDNMPNPPLIAYGPDLPESTSATPTRPDAKRRRTSGAFSSTNPATNGISLEPSSSQQDNSIYQPSRSAQDPLHGTRPTRILLGYWKGSSEFDPKNRHAVYGILGQNDMFRVKLVRETRDGRYVDGNFPMGAGALWIQYEEVEFEEHLKPLARMEIKEYCRVRQWQIDHGEKPEERIANETKAVYEAQARVGSGYKNLAHQPAPSFAVTPDEPEAADAADAVSTRAGFGGHELRQSRRVEAKNDARAATRQSLIEAETRPAATSGSAAAAPAPATRTNSADALERTSSLARREIARVEAAQSRADRYASTRERAAAAAADAAKAAAAAAAPDINGRMRFHESEDVQRLNKVWARQESLRMKAGAEDAKIYGGIKYERKSNGPFMGKLVSQGTIISIDGEDYVEYRVLTKPSFF